MAGLVSVIIPVFNCASYVCQAIDSVLSQRVRVPLEVIVVDDGSTDDLPAVLHPYGNQLRYVRRSHGGIGAARNTGLQHAKGDVAAFLDADDYWLPGRLQKMLERHAAEAHAVILTDLLIHDMRSGVQASVGYGERNGLRQLFELPAHEQYRHLLERNYLNYMCLVPRPVFERVGLFDESLTSAEDWDFQLRCLAAGIAARVVPEPLAVYRLYREGATTTQDGTRRADSILKILAKHRHRVSSRRWARAVGERDLVYLKVALRRHSYPAVVTRSLRLLANVSFTSGHVARRWQGWRRASLGVKPDGAGIGAPASAVVVTSATAAPHGAEIVAGK